MPSAFGQGIYRNADDVVRARRDEAAMRWRDQVEALERDLFDLYGRRLGRTAFGMVGMVGFAVMALSAFRGPGVQTAILGLSWAAMLVAWLACRVAAPNQLR